MVPGPRADPDGRRGRRQEPLAGALRTRRPAARRRLRRDPRPGGTMSRLACARLTLVLATAVALPAAAQGPEPPRPRPIEDLLAQGHGHVEAWRLEAAEA